MRPRALRTWASRHRRSLVLGSVVTVLLACSSLPAGEKALVTNDGRREDPAILRREDAVLIDVNLADVALLSSLPGIGPAMAARIVERREAFGPFASVEDLTRVRGIGDVKLRAIADRVAVRARDVESPQGAD